MKRIPFQKSAMLYALMMMALLCGGCEDLRPGYGSRLDEIEIYPGTFDPNEQSELPEITPELLDAAGVTTELMRSKAEAYRASSTSDDGRLRSGVYLYTASVDKYEAAPEQLAARVALLGFRDVYLSPDKRRIQEADPWLRTFVAACTGYGIKVYAIRIATNDIFIDEGVVNNDVNLVKTYNAAVNPEERFAGIAADLEPHTVKETMSGLPYTWDSDNHYGKGGHNDKLLKITIDRMKQAGDLLKPMLGLNEAIFYNYQRKFDEGLLTYGSVPDFLASCDWVIVMAYLNTKEAIWDRSEASLRAAWADEGLQQEKSVSICVKTAVNHADSSTLQPEGWAYLLETLDYIKEKGLTYASFRGIDMFTYEGLETMWEWQNDKE